MPRMQELTKHCTIAICFEEPAITFLFSKLLQANGCTTTVLEKVSDLAGDAKIITEPQYFPQIQKEYQDRCLLVGNKDAVKDLPVLTLSRPLTEAKIEHALEHFLSS
ncbi:hypothetical protein OAO01_06765 [Oligoflexia bacterium]|nr:hypothetical protein [Oligoflexia bacterium]